MWHSSNSMLVRSAFSALLILLRSSPVRAQAIVVTGSVEVAPGPDGNRAADASNVVVWLMPLGPSPSPEQTTANSDQRPRLVQKNKSFDPHILVVEKGASVDFPNRDPFFHNVFSLFEGKRFDLELYEAGTTRSVVFDKVGISYIFCNIHPEMSAVVIALDTPYYAQSNRAGQITIRNVSSGTYALHVWQEGALTDVLNRFDRQITISADVRSLGTIRLPRTPNLYAKHKNKYGRDYDTAAPANPVYPQP